MKHCLLEAFDRIMDPTIKTSESSVPRKLLQIGKQLQNHFDDLFLTASMKELLQYNTT